MPAPIEIGDRFKLTGRFLRATGQTAGGEGQSEWMRTECGCGLCSRGGFVASNQHQHCGTCQSTGGIRVELVHATSNEPCPDCEGYMRHFSTVNVYKVGSRDVRNVDVNPTFDGR